MGNVFTIQHQKITVRPLKSQIQAIQKIPAPKSTKQCKSFCHTVYYLSLFFQKTLKIIVPHMT